MTPQLSPSQGRIVRALVLYLSKDSHKHPTVVVEAVRSNPWSSLTFAGERHQIAVRLPAGAAPVIVDNDLIVQGTIVALARADWTTTGDGTVGEIDLLTLAMTEYV